MGICEKIWSSGVSPKRASKMQLRNVDLRSVGPSVQKLWPTTFFARKMPCILHCNEKKIWISFSRLDRGLVQKAKWSKIFRRSRIQAVPTISNNLCQSVLVYSAPSSSPTTACWQPCTCTTRGSWKNSTAPLCKPDSQFSFPSRQYIPLEK